MIFESSFPRNYNKLTNLASKAYLRDSQKRSCKKLPPMRVDLVAFRVESDVLLS